MLCAASLRDVRANVIPAALPSAGTQTIWSSLMMIPNSVLNAATGIPESTFTEFKKYPLVIAPGTGGESCLAKCNITFQEVRGGKASPKPCARLPDAL